MPGGVVSAAAVAAAVATHPEHVSVAEARLNPCARTIEIAMRVDSTHLEEALQSHTGARVGLETTPEVDAIIEGYLAGRFEVREQGTKGAAALWPIDWIGFEPEGLDVWLYFEIGAPDDLGASGRLTLEVRHRVMQELLARQVNMITFHHGDAKKTLRFTVERADWQTLELPYADPDDYATAIDCWHRRRLQRLWAPDGWLTLVGLEWLHQGGQMIPGIGTFTRTGTDVVYQPEAGLAVEGRPVGGHLRDDAHEKGPSVVRIGSVSFHAIRRGTRVGIRVRDSASELRRGFSGVERFPVDRAWRIEATYDPPLEPTAIAVDSVIGVTTEQEIAGYAVFEHAGHACRMVLMPGGSDETFLIVFGDATNGETTHDGGRFLAARLEADGTIVLDFNRAYNPPCAFTDFATCPLPVAANRLPFPVHAGEKRFPDP
jgi:uncharacterized protein (DUF1684 family)